MRQKKNTGATVVSVLLAVGSLLAVVVIFAAGILLEGINTGSALDITALFDKEKQQDVFAETTAQPQATDDWAAEFNSREANYAYLTRYQDDAAGVVRYNIEGVNGDTSVWLRQTEYPIDDIEHITEIGCVYSQGMYLFVEDGMVIALDIASGDELWYNADFGGYLPLAMIDENDMLYLHCEGDTGADLTVIELATGYTLAQADGIIPAGFSDAKWLEQTDYPDVVRINYAGGPDDADNYAFEYDWVLGEMFSQPEVSAALTWQDAYALALDRAEEYRIGSLIFLTDDDIPEIYLCGEHDGIARYDETTGVVSITQLQDGSMYYDYKGGRFLHIVNEGDVRISTVYEMTGSGLLKRGEFRYDNVETDREKAYMANGMTCDAETYNAEMDKVFNREEERSVEYHGKTELKQLLADWDKPVEQHTQWKQWIADQVSYYAEEYADAAFSLVDLDGDGIEEMYLAYDHDSAIPIGRFITMDPRTMQTDAVYVQPDNVAYGAGDGLLYNTNIITQNFVADEVYRFADGNVELQWKGNRRFYSETEVTYLIDGAEVAEEEYLEAFAQHFAVSNIAYVADHHMTLEQMLAQLQ